MVRCDLWIVSRDTHHQRHVTFEVKAPPISGPMAEATPKKAPKEPIKIGRFGAGTAKAAMVYAPEVIPAPPTPAMALPTINVVLESATPAYGQQ